MCGLGINNNFFPFSRSDSNFSELEFFNIITKTRAINYEHIKVYPEDYNIYSAEKLQFFPSYKVSGML